METRNDDPRNRASAGPSRPGPNNRGNARPIPRLLALTVGRTHDLTSPRKHGSASPRDHEPRIQGSSFHGPRGSVLATSLKKPPTLHPRSVKPRNRESAVSWRRGTTIRETVLPRVRPDRVRTIVETRGRTRASSLSRLDGPTTSRTARVGARRTDGEATNAESAVQCPRCRDPRDREDHRPSNPWNVETQERPAIKRSHHRAFSSCSGVTCCASRRITDPDPTRTRSSNVTTPSAPSTIPVTAPPARFSR